MIRDVTVTAGSLIGALLWKFGGPGANLLTATAIGAAATIVYSTTLFIKRPALA